MEKSTLQRLTLEELAEIMPVVNENEQEECVGGGGPGEWMERCQRIASEFGFSQVIFGPTSQSPCCQMSVTCGGVLRVDFAYYKSSQLDYDANVRSLMAHEQQHIYNCGRYVPNSLEDEFTARFAQYKHSSYASMTSSAADDMWSSLYSLRDQLLASGSVMGYNCPIQSHYPYEITHGTYINTNQLREKAFQELFDYLERNR